jgi:WD40 repeat protein
MQPKTAAKELGKPIQPPCQVTRLRFSPDGKLLAAACVDGLVRRWDVTGKEPVELDALKGHNGWVTGLAYMSVPKAQGLYRLYSSDSWGRLTCWNPEGRPIWSEELAHDGWARMLDVGSDKAVVVSCGKDGRVRLWSAAGGKPDVEWNVGADVQSIACSPTDHFLLAGDRFGIVREFDYARAKVIHTFEAKELYKLDRIQDVGGVRCLLFDPTGKTLMVAGAVPSTGGFVQCTPLIVAFDRSTGKRLWQWKGASDNEGYTTDLAWHRDGYLIGSASGQPGQGKVFFLKPGEAPFFVAAKPNVHSVALHPDGIRFAAALTNANSSGNGRVGGANYLQNVSPIQFWQVQKAD